MPDVLVVVPARMAATRLPGKPLASIAGEPMVAHVVRAALAAEVGEVAAAVSEAEVAEAAARVGARAVMTDPGLPSGTDRVRAAADALDPDGRFEIVVNLQGDMPFIAPALIRAGVAALKARAEAAIATLVAPASPDDLDSPDVVKAVLALDEGARGGRALWFTRGRPYGEGPDWRHVGLYAFRRAALDRFCDAPPSPLERRERLEQLRALEMGLTIRAAIVEAAPASVDTAADLEAVRREAEART